MKGTMNPAIVIAATVLILALVCLFVGGLIHLLGLSNPIDEGEQMQQHIKEKNDTAN